MYDLIFRDLCRDLMQQAEDHGQTSLLPAMKLHSLSTSKQTPAATLTQAEKDELWIESLNQYFWERWNS